MAGFRRLAIFCCGLLLAALATGEIPQACIDTGAQLQSSCASDIEMATTFFGGSTTPDGAMVDAYLSDTSNKVTSTCCEAAQAFNDAKCNCEPDVIQLAASYTNGDASVYDKVAQAVSQSCGFTKIC